jgi:protein-disulfide isomerase
MSKALALGITGAALSVAMLAAGFVAGNRAAPVAAGASAGTAASTVSRGEVELIVRDYLLRNPEILGDMQAELEDRQREAQRVALLDAIGNSSDAIFNAAHDGVVGNPEGSTTVVEFFDYNCGFCKRAHEDMTAMVAADPDLRFVLKEFPILGPESQAAHVVSMAFRALAPEKYGEFHDAVLMGEGRATEASAVAAAVALGVDEAALREEMKNPAIAEAFRETYELAQDLAITGTPSYVIGQEVVFGALGKAVLAEKVALAREKE